MLSPQEFLQQNIEYANQLKKAKDMGIYVGLPKEKIGGKIYKSGSTVVEVGARHEYGEGVPQRSFLRAPFAVKKKELDASLLTAFRKVADGKADAKTALDLVGVRAQVISQSAFDNNGFGSWKAISAATVAQKGSSKPLIDTGTLRASITWVVR